MNATDLLAILSHYLQLFPEEQGKFELLTKQLQAGDTMDDPQTLPGHITGSAFVLSPDRTKLLLIHHKFLQKWLQPGGHWDPGESDPLAAAQREAVEETGVTIAEYLPLVADQPLIPFDIDSHPIPERPERNMPAHTHHDFRYIFVAASEDLTKLEAEVYEAGWFEFDAPECHNVTEIIEKLQHLLAGY